MAANPPFPAIMIAPPAVPDSLENSMPFRRLRLMTFVPCVGIGFLLLSPKVTGLLSALLLVGVLITLHELGHFLAARRMGAPVDVFSIGFGPRLFGFQWKETDVRLAAIPLGGYVRLAGEDSEVGTGLSEDHSFFQKPYHQRLLFYAGGIIANVLTALVLLAPLRVDEARSRITFLGPMPVESVIGGKVADKAGVKAGDKMLSIGELTFPGADPEKAVPYIRSKGGKSLPITLERGGERLTVHVVPEGAAGEGRIGLQFGTPEYRVDRDPLTLASAGTGLKGAVTGTWDLAAKVAGDYYRLFTGQVSVKELGGPVSIVRIGSQAAQAGWRVFFFFAAYISMNLAVLNALPIPGLDGSHALILTIERLRRKNFSIAVKERILTAGFYVLLGVLVLVLGMDLWRLKH